MRFILRYLRDYRRHFLPGALLLLATNALTLLIPWLLKGAIDELRADATMGVVTRYALGISFTAMVLAAIRTSSRRYILGASRLIVCDIRDTLFAHIQTLPASFFARHQTGEIMSRAVNDLRLIRVLFGPVILNVVNVALLSSIGLALMAIIDPTLTWFAVIPFPALVIAIVGVSRRLRLRSNAVQEQLGAISSKVQENLSGMNLIKAYGRESCEIEAFDKLSQEYRARQLLLTRSRALVVTLTEGLRGLSVFIVLWLGGQHVVAGTLSPGGFVAFISYLALLSGPAIATGRILGFVQRGLGAIRRIEEILAERSDLPGDRASEPAPPLSGAVAFRNLDFSYPDGAPAVLQGIDLRVRPGTVVGIVGPVGSGKSTLMQLLATLYPAPDGTLFVDDRDVNTIPTGHMREFLGVVPQETFLFSRTIAENIALGQPEAPPGRIEEVARVSQLDRDLMQLPHGLDTVVGERGVTLSGGQRQRVALARALLDDPRILILDDALSSVDADTEESILRGLRENSRERTTFVISHRISTVLTADYVVVLAGGRIVESGTVRDLLAADGLFGAMQRQQRLETELEEL